MARWRAQYLAKEGENIIQSKSDEFVDFAWPIGLTCPTMQCDAFDVQSCYTSGLKTSEKAGILRQYAVIVFAARCSGSSSTYCSDGKSRREFFAFERRVLEDLDDIGEKIRFTGAYTHKKDKKT